MAYFGLSNPVIAKRTTSGAYEQGMEVGKNIATSVTPQYAEGSLYANNAVAEHVKKFTKANVEVEVSTIPLAAAAILFGHAVVEADKKETSKGGDLANECGYGFVCTNRIDDAYSYTGVWLPRVLFSEGEESYQTVGESISFGTPKLSGEATCDASDTWREKQTFTTEADAYDFIRAKAGIATSGQQT